VGGGRGFLVGCWLVGGGERAIFFLFCLRQEGGRCENF